MSFNLSEITLASRSTSLWGIDRKSSNTAINLSRTSQHCQGRALDLDADVFGKVTNAEIFHYIKDCLDFDQLIWRLGDDSNPDSWLQFPR